MAWEDYCEGCSGLIADILRGASHAPGCPTDHAAQRRLQAEPKVDPAAVSARSTQLWRVAEIEADGTLRVQGFTSGGVPVVERTFARVPLGTEPPLRTCPRSYDRALADSLQAAEQCLEQVSKQAWPSVLDALIEVRKCLAENRVRLGDRVIRNGDEG